MLIYNYHPATSEYLGSSQARPDPREPERYLLPANATRTAPPVPGENQAAIWRAGEWQIVTDFRGTYYWVDGIRHLIVDLEVEVPAGAYVGEDPPPPSLDEAKAAAYGKLSADHEAYIAGRGYTLGWQNSCSEYRLRFDRVIADAGASVEQKAAAQSGLDRIQALQDWIMGTCFRYFGGIAQAIFAASTEAELAAVTWDYEQFSASDPGVSIGTELLPLDIASTS